jgi:uncharacterized protein YndB with AHSA1/START domain
MSEIKKPEHRGRVIRESMRTTATPGQLWEAWADPARLAQWFPDRAEGRAVEGGIQTWYFDRFKYAMPYEIASAVEGRHLVFTGQPPGRPRFYLEVEITTEAGSTVLTLANSGFLDASGWDEEYEGIASGWRMSLALLKLYAERYYGRDRVQFFAMRPARYEYGDLLPFYRSAERLAAWLTTAGAIGDAGTRYHLALQNGAEASGDILAVTGWEVQLAWDEIGGALALKGFGMGAGRRAVCVHGSGWDIDAARAAGLETFFGGALDRLAVAIASQSSPLVGPA